MQPERFTKQHRHNCSHERNHHTDTNCFRDENFDSTNLRKSTAGSMKNLPPKQKHNTTEKFPLELCMLERELEYYKQELARAQQNHQPTTHRTAQEDTRLQTELQRANRERTKLKKEHEVMSKEQEKLVKKLNDLEAKVARGDRQIQSLRTVRDSKKEKKAASGSKHTSNPEQVPKLGGNAPQSMANLHKASGTALQQLQHENKLLRERLAFFEAAHKDAESTFEPILRENAVQIRELMTEKGRLAKENVQLKQKSQSYESSSKHFQQKYKAIEVAFAKLRVEYDKATKALVTNSRIEQPTTDPKQLHQLREKLKQSEAKIEQVQAANENHRNRIIHLENTNRYLVGENRRLSSNGGSNQPSSIY